MKYKTNQRERILDYLIENKNNHCTADMIVNHFANTNEPIGKATVYRYLDILVENSIVRKYVTEEGKSACFQYISPDDKCHMHYHFKCNRCGKLLHISCELINQVREHVLNEHGFTIDSSQTVFYGICEKCKKEKDA